MDLTSLAPDNFIASSTIGLYSIILLGYFPALAVITNFAEVSLIL
jgi:hypothetical protein